MAKGDGPKLGGWDEPPQPLGSRGGPGERPRVRQFGLVHIMVAVVYFAVLSWDYTLIQDGQSYVPRIAFGVMVGLGFCGVGLWAVSKMARSAIVGWVLFVIGYLFLTGFTTSFLTVPTLPILIGAIIYLGSRRHANDQDALLWVLQVAAEREIPLAPGVEVFSGQVRGMYRVWAESLADLLLRGVPLPDALDSIPRLVPRRAALLIRTGWESGNLALGLKEAGASRETNQPVLHAITGRLAYLGWVSTIGSAIVGFVLYFIVPKFEAIFHDFGINLPVMTRFVIRGSHFVVDYAWLGTFVLLGLAGYGLARLFGPGDLSIPVFDRLLARRHVITILRALAVVVAAGRPIPPALESLSRSYPTRWVRKKLGRAAEDANLGVEWTEALRATGLLSSRDVGVFAAAERAGNLAWAIRELAETGERRWAYRLQAWSQVLFAVAMLILGLLVLVLTVAFMLPLSTLIERLSG